MVWRQRGFEPGTGSGGGSDAPPTARWLAWAAACLLVAALVSAGVIGFGNGSPDGAVVSAAGGTASTVGVPSTVTVPPPASSTAPAAPTSTIRTTTTLPRAAAEVLRAIGTTAPPTTQPPAPPTTGTPVTPTTATTVRPSTTTTSTTPPQATVRVVNQFDRPLEVTVNMTVFTVAARSAEGPKPVTLPATGDDVIKVSDTACPLEVTADHFQPGGSHEVTVSPGPGPGCTTAIVVGPA